MAKVELYDVCKVYKGNVKAVSDFNLKIKDGEFVIFVGPSGCGKSTTLRMIAGLEEITSGKIYIGETLVNNIEPKDRDIAMVFQNYALYPHMSVYDNLAYSLKCHHENKDVINKKVNEVAELLNIKEYLERKPKELSGGQRQRVALGRCLIRNPKVFLFDEPLSNLDAKLRVQMRSEISKLHKEVKGTFIYVTHDQTEAMTMGDRIVVMKDGFIQQIDTPVNLYEHPINIFVATFLGSPQMNIFKVTLKNNTLFLDDNVKFKLSEKIINKINGNYENEELSLGIRPNDFSLGNKIDFDFVVEKIDLIEKLGNETLVYINLPGRSESTIISLKLDMSEKLEAPLYLKINKERIHLFNKTEESILKINDFNFLPVNFETVENDLLINNKYKIKNIENKLVGSLNNVNKGFISFKSDEINLNRLNEDDICLDLKVVAFDIRSDKYVYYAKDNVSNMRITFISENEIKLDETKLLKVYVSLDLVNILDENLNILTVNQEIKKPIKELNIKQIGKDFYVLNKDKNFIKENKYFLVTKIFDLNANMLLVVKNQKGDELSILTSKNSDYFNGMILYIKKEK